MKILVDDITFQLILFNTHYTYSHQFCLHLYIYIYIYYFFLYLKIIYVPVRLSIHDNLYILHPAFSPFYLHRQAYLRVLRSALNATSELSVHVDG